MEAASDGTAQARATICASRWPIWGLGRCGAAPHPCVQRWARRGRIPGARSGWMVHAALPARQTEAPRRADRGTAAGRRCCSVPCWGPWRLRVPIRGCGSPALHRRFIADSSAFAPACSSCSCSGSPIVLHRC